MRGVARGSGEGDRSGVRRVGKGGHQPELRIPNKRVKIAGG